MNRDTDRDWGEALRERVHDMETPPSNRLWDDIEQSLDGVQPSLGTPRRHIWRWVGSVAAAAAAAVIIAMLQLDPTPTVEEIIDRSFERSTPEIAQRLETPANEEMGEHAGELTTPKSLSPKSSSPKVEIAESVEELVIEESAPPTKEVERASVSEHDNSAHSNKYRNYNSLSHNDSRKGRARKQTSLSLSGSGSLFSQASNGASAMPAHTAAYAALVDPIGYRSGSNSIYNYCEATHHQPFSVGLRVQHSLLPRLRLVSGLNYTQLISDITYPSNTSLIDERQHIHFIGVPLRLDYGLYTSEHFTLYAGAGGAIEYCVGATLGDKKVDEKRWHYSTGIALGAEYRANSWLGFYFEPELNYALTTTQLKSSRNDSPTTCTLRLGVSFTL